MLILTEMVHDARVVRMNAEHLPPTIRKWMGDSVGHWEGDTLVVDTTNFTDKTRFRGSTTEPARRRALHARRREDAALPVHGRRSGRRGTKPWTGEYPWPATDEQIYEYACHEGNYAMGNILRGARLKEADDAKRKTENKRQ